MFSRSFLFSKNSTAKKAVKNFGNIHNLKFGRAEAKTFKLKNMSLPASLKLGVQPNWRISQPKLSTDIHLRHLAPSAENIVQENCYVNKPWQLKAGKIEHAIQFSPLIPASPIDYIRIAFHANRQLSLLAMAKPGVGNRLHNALIASDDDLSSQHRFDFAPKVGVDPRARASLLLSMEREESIDQVQQFLGGLHHLTTFNEPVLHLCQQTLNECQRQLDEPGPWKPLINLPVEESNRDVGGYPNFLPDDPDINTNYYYHAKDIIDFPNQIPAIHRCILEKDVDGLFELLKQDPLLLYRRDPFGNLPIELAKKLWDFEVAESLFLYWYQLPPQQRFLDNLFLRQANDIHMAIAMNSERRKNIDRQGMVNEYRNWPIPQRPKLHQDILRGQALSLTDFSEEAQAFEKLSQALYQIAYDTAKECHTMINSLPPEVKSMTLYRHPKVSYTLEEELRYLADRLVINEQDLVYWKSNWERVLHFMKNADCELPKHGLVQGDYGDLIQGYERLLKIKANSIKQFNDAFQSYKTSCYQKDATEFYTWTYLLAVIQSKAAILANYPQSHIDIDWQLAALKGYHKESLSQAEISRYSVFHMCYERQFLNFCRQGLLSFEMQDDWGYTPLLLAIVTNQIDTVKEYLSSGLFKPKVWVRTGGGNGIYYTLLEHAPTVEMVELLMHHFYPTNEESTLPKRGSLTINQALQRYRFRPDVKQFQLSLIEEIMLGRSHRPDSLSLLRLLLRHHDEEVVEGPYDDNVPQEVAEIVSQHNQRVRSQAQSKLSAVKLAGIRLENATIVSQFYQNHLHRKVACTARLMPVSNILHDMPLRNNLADIFSQCFRMREFDSPKARELFFQTYLNTHASFFIEVYHDSQDNPVGFCTFTLKETHDTSKPDCKSDLTLYMSMAACASGTPSGMPLYTHKIVYTAWQLAQNENKSLYFYGRYGRPGLAFKLLPPEAKYSVKYAFDEQRQHHTMEDVSGDKLNNNGTSTPPVLSLAMRKCEDDVKLEEYDYWLNNKLSGQPNQSLPLMFEVDEQTILGWRKMHYQQNGLTDEWQNRFNQLFTELNTLNQQPTIPSKL
jgi:hypothetical protein